MIKMYHFHIITNNKFICIFNFSPLILRIFQNYFTTARTLRLSQTELCILIALILYLLFYYFITNYFYYRIHAKAFPFHSTIYYSNIMINPRTHYQITNLQKLHSAQKLSNFLFNPTISLNPQSPRYYFYSQNISQQFPSFFSGSLKRNPSPI